MSSRRSGPFHHPRPASDAPAAAPSEPPPPFPDAPPEAARGLAPDALARLDAYGRELATGGVVRGLIGPREVPRLWDRHLLNCAALAELIQPGETVADIGTGAGLPGLVLALVRPDLRVILVEPLQRRCDFLAEMIKRFDLGKRVSIRRGKANAVPPCQADVVTSRAVAALDELATWSLPHARVGGRLLAMKGQKAAEELAAAAPVLARWGADTDAAVLACGAWLEAPVQVVRADRRK
jgi:16S rRNA (guanine527-N7)-methyltransferase